MHEDHDVVHFVALGLRCVRRCAFRIDRYRNVNYFCNPSILFPSSTLPLMHLDKSSSVWWGPPKKFDTQFKERKISWLELFYDLVYVIAISRLTHHLTSHISLHGFLEYAALFILVFWGWLNGSLYHDLHGNAGLRTRLMILWQMMIIAAVTITIDQ